MNSDMLIKKRGHEIILFAHSYFDGKIRCNGLFHCKKLIHLNKNNHVRVQIGDFRLLLKPEESNGGRYLDGYTSKSELMRYFNDKKEPSSYVMGDYYYSTPY